MAATIQSGAKNVIVGTAGHIDHGKSALVEALTGTHPDRLEEERRRGITIDLGFAFLELDGIHLGFVDVPGHERFVRNMLAGAGGIDLVLLVIAANEGVKPQTREHFEICRLLGISRGIVALTKSDLVDADSLTLAKLALEEFLRGSFLDGAPIVSVSSHTHEGMDEMRKALALVAGTVPARDSRYYFRLPIDRAFAMKGFGTVVTGSLVSGSLSPEDEVELHPGARRLRVRGVQSGGHKVESAFAGQRTALNLTGIDLNELHRGMVLTMPGHFSATRHLDARITLLDSARPLKSRARVHFHQGTAETVAEVALLDVAQLAPGRSALAYLILKDETLLLPGDRFILRQFSPLVTIGGGTVLQTVRRKRPRDPEASRLLQILERGNKEEVLAALIEAAPRGISLENVVARTAWLADDAISTAEVLERKNVLRILKRAPLFLASAARVNACAQNLREAVIQFHHANPLSDGMNKEDLRARAASDAGPDIFQVALDQAVAAGELSVVGDIIKQAGHSVNLNREEAEARRKIEDAFEKAGLTPAEPAELLAALGLNPKLAQNLLQLLLRERVLVKVTEGIILHARTLAHLRQLLQEYKRDHGSRLTVPAFKELTGVSRKFAIPLLEHFDRTGVTRREGDTRVIL
jgi:selenocysteine-specific elongation factor